jgi:Uma2 family endonuclease
VSTAHLVTLEEYLKTDYQPDREYLDGEVVERNLGEYEHARLQAALILWFGTREREWNIRVVPELRVQVSPTRYRVPDVTVLDGNLPIEQIITRPPLNVIEILSPEDTVRAFERRIDDYLDFGVENIWILDPALTKAWVATRGQLTEVSGYLMVAGTFFLSVPEIFKSEE